MEVNEEEIIMAVVESRLSADEKRAFLEAKRKALVPWQENEFYLHDNKARFHINAFALTGLQITVSCLTLADQNLLV